MPSSLTPKSYSFYISLILFCEGLFSLILSSMLIIFSGSILLFQFLYFNITPAIQGYFF